MKAATSSEALTKPSEVLQLALWYYLSGQGEAMKWCPPLSAIQKALNDTPHKPGALFYAWDVAEGSVAQWYACEYRSTSDVVKLFGRAMEAAEAAGE